MDRRDRASHSLSRRRVLVGGASLTAAALAGVQPRAAVAADSLTVAIYGGQLGAGVRAAGDPWAKQSGTQINVDEGVSMVTLGKLRQQKANPTIDVAWMDGGVSEIAYGEGLVEPIDLTLIPNAKDLFPAAIHKDKSGGVYALTGGFYAIGMAYNKERIKRAPSSWKDLTRPEYAGVVTTASPANATWPNWFAEMTRVYGGDLNHPEAFLAAMKNVKVVAFWDSAGQADNLFQSGEAQVGVEISGNVWALTDKGVPVVYVVPKEGAVAGDVRAHIVKGTKSRALAHQYINGVVSPAGQANFVATVYYAPANRKTPLTQQERQRMPYGEHGSMANLVIPDWFAIDPHKSAWIELWNKTVVAHG